MPGFVPVKYHKSGKILLLLAAGLVVVGAANRFYLLVFFGLAMGLLALYLIYVVPREK